MSKQIDTSEFEKYLFAENKQEFLKQLVPNSVQHLYFTILHALNTQVELSKEQQKLLNDLLQVAPSFVNKGHQCHELQLRSLLKQLSSDQVQEEEKQKIIQKLRDIYFQLSFNWSRPADLGQTSLSKEGQIDKWSSKLENNQIDVSNIFEQAYKNIDMMRKITRDFLNVLDVEKIRQNSSSQICQYFVDNVNDLHALKNPPQILKNLYQRKRQEGYNSFNLSNYYNRLTLKQLEELGSIMSEELKNEKEYVAALFRKNFQNKLDKFNQKQLNELDLKEKQLKRDLLASISSWAKKHANKNIIQQLFQQIDYEILVIDLALQKCELARFVDFLENPTRGNISIPYESKYREKLDKTKVNYDSFWHNVHRLQTAQWISDSDLVRGYLEFFYYDAKDYSQFANILEESYRKQVFYTVKLQKGEKFQNAQQLLSSNVWEELIKKKEITILASNQQYFKPFETVALKVDIKNIQNLTVKIFEIQTEHYYLKTNSAFDNSLSLDGIIPSTQQEFKYNDPPIVKSRQEFKFDFMNQKSRGVFIVEFLGSGISSRAIVRKGALALLEKCTINGQQLTLVSEDKNVCHSKRSGIWIKNKFFETDQNGQVMIPYSDSSQNDVPVILVHEDYSELTKLNLKQESYDFQCAFLYQQESFLRGNKAKVVIQPRLYVNNLPTSLKILQDTIITAVLTNELNIPTTYTFKNLVFDLKEEVEIEIPVQNLVRNINIQVSASIKKLNGQLQNVQKNHLIEFNLYDQSNKFNNIYLKHFAETGYVLYVLGKNGEPKQDMAIQFQFLHKYLVDIQSLQANLKTDVNGAVYLGHLDNITMISADMKQFGDLVACKKAWNLSKIYQQEYPSQVNICKGEDIELPYINNDQKGGEIVFSEVIEKNGNNILQDLSNQVKIQNNRLIISKLPVGYYRLFLQDKQTLIYVNVVDGYYWDKNPAFIISEENNSFEQVPDTEDNNLAILGIQEEEKKKELIINLLVPNKQKNDLVRVHIFANNFVYEDSQTISQQFRNIRVRGGTTTTTFGLKKSIFLNNKQLGDEICYVLDRKNQEKFIGNTLEKPQILLKRTEVRDTNFDKEVLEKDKEFKEGLQDRFYDMAAASNYSAQMSYNKMAQQQVLIEKGCDSFLNFLEFPCFVLSNLRIDANGKVVIKDFPFERYSQLTVVATNLAASVSAAFPLKKKVDAQHSPLRDQRLVSQLVKGKFYCEKRGANYLLSKQKLAIQSDSQNVIIDNLAQFFDIQQQLRIAQHGSDRENETGYRFWSFLKNWNELNNEQKQKKYDEFACHELNVFLYFKDPTFFKNTIEPFIRNKIEKSFVDYFLINSQEKLLSYASTENIQQINAMEQCLLILFLVNNGQKERAQQIANTIECSSKTRLVDSNLRKKLFDTVLSAKTQSDYEAKMKEKVEKSRNVNLKQKQQEIVEDEDMEWEIMAEKQMVQQSVQAPKKMAANTMLFRKEVAHKAYDLAEQDERLIDQRKNYQPGYQKLKKTVEYVERTYFGLKDEKQQKSYIKLNGFWSDLAVYLAKGGAINNFLSENFIFATSNHAEMVSVLAFIGLQFQGGDFQLASLGGRKIEIQAAGQNLIIFQKEIVEGKPDIKGDITITQRFFDPKDRYTYQEDDPSVKVEKYVDEYLIDKVYGCQVIVTNCSISNLEFQILSEIPEGSIPVKTLEYTQSQTLPIDSYSTQRFEFFFYFPSVGKFSVYPANVSRNEKILSTVEKNIQFDVKKEKTINKMETFYDILRSGHKKDILQYISEKNILNDKIFKFSDVYWLLKEDKQFYQEFIGILRKRAIFDRDSWYFSFLHGDVQGVCDLLNNSEFQESMKGLNQIQYFSSKTVQIDKLKLYEYYPLLSSRAHSFMNEKKSKILNVQFKDTYSKFVQYLAQVKFLQNHHFIVWAYYLLLQERVDEAIKIFSKIDAKNLSSTDARIQYDYLAAYLDIYSGYPNFQQARNISQKYLDYPVLQWRKLFKEIDNQLKEFDGTDKKQEKDAEEQQSEMSKNLKQAEFEEQISFEIDKNNIIIYHQNVKQCSLNFYVIDLEVLFSRTPFLENSKNKDEFTYVKPNYSERIELKQAKSLEKLNYKIPENLEKKNLLIQVISKDNILSQTYYSTSLKVQIIENYGQLKVLDHQNNLIPKVYVKCYAKTKSGEEQFYRDGYTDLRGRFDYALSSSSDINTIEKFSILICSDDKGSLIREAPVPSSLGKMEETIVLKTRKQK